MQKEGTAIESVLVAKRGSEQNVLAPKGYMMERNEWCQRKVQEGGIMLHREAHSSYNISMRNGWTVTHSQRFCSLLQWEIIRMSIEDERVKELVVKSWRNCVNVRRFLFLCTYMHLLQNYIGNIGEKVHIRHENLFLFPDCYSSLRQYRDFFPFYALLLHIR